MIEQIAPSCIFFNSDYVTIVEGQISISEKKVAGAGTVTFDVSGPSLLMRAHDSAPLVWALKNGKCAEGAFVTFVANQAHLHIVELKSTLRETDWIKVLKQFEGMFFSALAVLGIMNIGLISKVTCYVAYKKERMDPLHTANPALIKTHVGKKNPFNGQNEWNTAVLQLPHSVNASIRKISRDLTTGDASYGAVI